MTCTISTVPKTTIFIDLTQNSIKVQIFFLSPPHSTKIFPCICIYIVYIAIANSQTKNNTNNKYMMLLRTNPLEFSVQAFHESQVWRLHVSIVKNLYLMVLNSCMFSVTEIRKQKLMEYLAAKGKLKLPEAR